MIDAGLPLVQCLDILCNQGPNKHFSTAILKDVKARREGATFATRCRSTPRCSTHSIVNLVAAGEVGGILDTILNRLAVYIEKNVKLKRQVKGAMIYPIAVIDDRRVVCGGDPLARSSRPSRPCSRTSAPSCRCPRRSSSDLRTICSSPTLAS